VEYLAGISGADLGLQTLVITIGLEVSMEFRLFSWLCFFDRMQDF
jgi:hypothetical protein